MAIARLLGLLLAVSALLGAVPASAHEANPLLVNITQLSQLSYQAKLTIPNSVPWSNYPTVRWPDGCVEKAPSISRCERSLGGAKMSLQWPQFNPALTLLVRVTDLQGAVSTVIVEPGQPGWTIPAEPSRTAVIGKYVRLGVTHILSGADHLLFLVSMMLIAVGLRSVAMAATGFTLGHSLTLALAALGKLHMPVPPTEALIALSVVLLAREALSSTRRSLLHRYPFVICMAFGLLHGLGFATALGEVGLPQGETLSALLAFNVGVEVGQIIFIAAALGSVVLVRQLTRDWRVWREQGQRALVARVAYGTGIVAMFWFLQRLALTAAI
jgi:hydrogenase/urease accessory protein HupE